MDLRRAQFEYLLPVSRRSSRYVSSWCYRLVFIFKVFLRLAFLAFK